MERHCRRTQWMAHAHEIAGDASVQGTTLAVAQCGIAGASYGRPRDLRQRLFEIPWPQCDARKSVLIEDMQESIERRVHHPGKAATTGDHALVAGRKAFDECEVWFGSAHNGAKDNLVSRLGEPHPA
jgi:hypothetical protein